MLEAHAMARKPNQDIRNFILANIEAYPASVASMTAEKFNVSRTTISRYFSELVREGIITAQGNTRSRKYYIANIVDKTFHLERNGFWNEDTVWREHLRPLFDGVRSNIIDICQYGATEMINNVLDHSQSPDMIVSFRQTYKEITMMVIDHGVGIFNKIQTDFRLEDARTALLELSKGKLTSDKRRHSGEGIYFTSRMFDKFSIMSGMLFYSRSRIDGDDWLIESHDRDDNVKGTAVTMKLNSDVSRTMREVFDKYQGEDIYFRRTHIPIVLGRYPGEQLISRSQAKRILARVTVFSEVLLDFSGVSDIGQPFADEIFRVFKNAHPETELVALGTNENIDRMIKYVQKDDETLSLPFDDAENN